MDFTVSANIVFPYVSFARLFRNPGRPREQGDRARWANMDFFCRDLNFPMFGGVDFMAPRGPAITTLHTLLHDFVHTHSFTNTTRQVSETVVNM